MGMRQLDNVPSVSTAVSIPLSVHSHSLTSQHINLLEPTRRPTSAMAYGSGGGARKFVAEPLNSQRRARARNVSGGDVAASKGAWK